VVSIVMYMEILFAGRGGDEKLSCSIEMVDGVETA
jgi:hypothetical protein